jgi:choline dehydrogenase
MPRNATLDEDIDRRLRDNQLRLAADLDRTYDTIVCGAGTSGSVVVRRLAEDRAVNVFLLEAGGCDDVPSVTEPGRWSTNLGEASDWAFQAEPNPNLGVEAIDNPNGMMMEGRGCGEC